jgi:hypothetical protein
MRSGTDAAAIVRALVASYPEDRLRSLVVALVLDGLMPPASISEPRRRRGGPAPAVAANGRRRKAREGKAAPAKRRGRKPKQRVLDLPVPVGNGAGDGIPVSAEALWRHAQKLEPTRPWLAVVRELEVKEVHARAAFRKLSLPPGVGPMAVTKFLTLPAG